MRERLQVSRVAADISLVAGERTADEGDERSQSASGRSRQEIGSSQLRTNGGSVMHASIGKSTRRAIAHRGLVLLPALVAVLSLAFAGAASAQTGFHASITGVTPKPKPCPGAAFLCGSASTNYGPAAWALVPISDTQVSNACAAYEAAVTFVLGDGSTLALDENGTACQPGNALSAPGGSVSDGNPFTFSGNWMVQSADGQFGSIRGEGTDTLHAAGARATGTYSQTS
jgi:hypothetical protein